MKRIYIEWIDAWSQDQWTNTDEALRTCIKPCMVSTSAYLLTESDDCLVICHSVNKTDNMVCGILNIPKGMIKKRKDG